MGCAVQMHEVKSRLPSTCSKYSVNYLFTSPKHYQCLEIYLKRSCGERVSDMLYFKHKYFTQPEITPPDKFIKASQDLTKSLKGNHNDKEEEESDAVKKLESVFDHKTALPICDLLTARE